MENISEIGAISDQRPKNTALWHLYLAFWKQLDSHHFCLPEISSHVELASFTRISQAPSMQQILMPSNAVTDVVARSF